MTDKERIQSILSEIEHGYIGYDNLHGDDGHGMRVIKEALERCQKAEESFEWCCDCKEYDKEKHCCHRFAKRIRKTVSDIDEHYRKLCKKQEKLRNYIDIYRNSNGRMLVMKSDVLDVLERLVVEE